MEKKGKCCSREEKATFYQDFLVLKLGQKMCCFPDRYEEHVIPKYRLCGARINKGANWKLLILGLFLLGVGIFCFLFNTLNKDDPRYSDATRTGGLLAGVIWTLLAAYLLTTPFKFQFYVTELQVLCDPNDKAAPACGYQSYWLRTFAKPDDDFIMLYVYGALNSNMPGYHSLAHLVDDALVSKVKPRMMTAIQIDPAAMPKSDVTRAEGDKTAGRRASHSNNPGFGKQLYVLEQQAGLFGDSGGVCGKLAPVKNTVRACFCENLLVIQNESKILCYPEAYEKFVIPKYKIASANFRKGGSTATLGLAQFLGVIGVLLLFIGILTGPLDFLVILGIVLIVLSILVVIATLFISVYAVDLIMQKKPPVKDEGMASFVTRALRNRILGPDVVTIMLRSEPDKDFVLSYVFGVLGSNMGGYHALTHLVKDNLIEPPEPRTIMGAIASTGLQSYVPSYVPDIDHGEAVIADKI